MQVPMCVLLLLLLVCSNERPFLGLVALVLRSLSLRASWQAGERRAVRSAQVAFVGCRA